MKNKEPESSPKEPNCLTGEKCHCGRDAVKKIAEVILPHEDQMRHEFTQYVCQYHFDAALRPYLSKAESSPLPSKVEKTAEEIIDKHWGHDWYHPNGDWDKPQIHDRDCQLCYYENRVIAAMEEYASQFKSPSSPLNPSSDLKEEEDEQKIRVYCENDKLFIKPEELFASKRVQELIHRMASSDITRTLIK